MVLLFGGCSEAVWVRVFNSTDHPIALLSGSDGKALTIPAGGSDCVMWTSVARGRDYGFVIQDSGKEIFYIVVKLAEDGNWSHSSSEVFPKESQKHKMMGLEFLVEYSSDGMIYALDASHEKTPIRLNPQPTGFPKLPN